MILDQAGCEEASQFVQPCGSVNLLFVNLIYMRWTFGNFSSEFHFGQEICVLLKIRQRWWWGGGGNIRRACVFVSLLLFYFSDKNGTYKLSLSGHSWKKGTFRNQWQSLINSRNIYMHFLHYKRSGGLKTI